MTTTALSEALAKLRQLKVPNWPAGRILGDIADEIESALASAEPVACIDERHLHLLRQNWSQGNTLKHPKDAGDGDVLLYTHAQPAAKVEALGDGLRDYPYLIGLAKVLRMRGDPENANALDSVAERIRKTAKTPASVPDGWLPIDGAPKDRPIDVWITNEPIYGQQWGKQPEYWAYCYYDQICGEWRTTRPGGHLRCVPERYVTHYRETFPPTNQEGATP